MSLSFECKKSDFLATIERICGIKNIALNSDDDVDSAVESLLFILETKEPYKNIEEVNPHECGVEGENLIIKLDYLDAHWEKYDKVESDKAKMEFIQIVKHLQKEILNPKKE